MDSMIYSPLDDFESKYKALHAEETNRYFDSLAKRSGVNIEENRRTVKEHRLQSEALEKLRKRLRLWKFLRVLMCITLLLIPLVIFKITPKIKALRQQIDEKAQTVSQLLALAHSQMAPLNHLFDDRDALTIIEKVIPMLSFAPCFSADQEENMRVNFDYLDRDDVEQSTTDVLAGHYNDNPFVFEKKLIHQMGTKTYHGSLTIRWTEHYVDSDGKHRTRTRTQTLHASVTKPKPYYSTKVILSYCAQGGPELCFSRDATNLDDKNERQLERYVKRGEKKLKKMTDQAIAQNRDFVSMSNTDFEVLFDALDRTDEVQFRTLFTPLAQTNMVDLICSQAGYGDDFHFIKRRRTNKIITEHSQARPMLLLASEYPSYSFDTAKNNFIKKNQEYFKAVYFDFAPLWAIPMYQERPVHSLDPIPDLPQNYSYKECEALSNCVNPRHVAHQATKTPCILKSSFVSSQGTVDEVCISAYSYDIWRRVDYVSVYGGDDRWHNVPVPWDEYIPLEAHNSFHIATCDGTVQNDGDILARRNNLCIFE